MKEIINSIKHGRIKLHELDTLICDVRKAIDTRRNAIEYISRSKLEHIGCYSINDERAVQANIENMIGCLQIPLGVAGPLLVRGNYANGEYFVPMGTTEGGLIASVNRGCEVIRKARGCSSIVMKDGMTRAPLFRGETAIDVVEASDEIKSHEEELKRIAGETSSHLSLEEIDQHVVGRNLWLRLSFHTGDAMGMNMVTIASDEICKYLEQNFGLKHVALSGNLCTDKKSSAINLIEGRGKSVISEVTIPSPVIEEKLHCSPPDMEEVCRRKCLIGSALAGSYGYNAHFANVIAAISIATGQDVAQVVETSQGFTLAELNDGKLHMSVTIPSLEVGTVGGGTSLETQEEALSILQCKGGGDPPGVMASKLAEIIGAAVLAGEISLIGSLAERSLAKAHAKLGRVG